MKKMKKERPVFRIAHIAMNTENILEAEQIDQFFSQHFGLSVNCGEKSSIVGNVIEVIRGSYLGTHGHIALATPDIDAAVEYLREEGVECDPDTLEYDADGKKRVIYLREELAGFAVHLARKEDL